jgi:hypothetical protein
MYKNTKALEKLIEQYLNDIDNRTNSFCNAYHLLERE